jgi:hypothetical protein
MKSRRSDLTAARLDRPGNLNSSAASAPEAPAVGPDLWSYRLKTPAMRRIRTQPAGTR